MSVYIRYTMDYIVTGNLHLCDSPNLDPVRRRRAPGLDRGAVGADVASHGLGSLRGDAGLQAAGAEGALGHPKLGGFPKTWWFGTIFYFPISWE